MQKADHIEALRIAAAHWRENARFLIRRRQDDRASELHTKALAALAMASQMEAEDE